jgi:transposase-like protein
VALKVVTMAELRLEVLLEAERTGMSVTEVCRRYGISQQTSSRNRNDLREQTDLATFDNEMKGFPRMITPSLIAREQPDARRPPRPPRLPP